MPYTLLKTSGEEEAYSELDQDKEETLYVIVWISLIIFIGCNLNIQGDPIKIQVYFVTKL